jgi:hypothetical protein
MSRRFLGGVDLASQKGLNVLTPTTTTDAATKAYVDASDLVSGSTVYTTAATLAAGIAGTEAVVNVNTGSLNLVANSWFRVQARIAWNAVTATVAPDWLIRKTNISGTIIYESVDNAEALAPTAVPYVTEFTGLYHTTTAESGVVFVVTAKRVGGTGTISVFGDAQGKTSLIVTRIGPDSAITTV